MPKLKSKIMRTIKFRAWDGKRMTTSGIMFNNSTGILEVPTIGNMGRPLSVKYQLMQFTGLHDKNGREIFEGDLLGEWLNIDGEKIQTAIPVLWSEEVTAFMVDLSALKDGSYCEFLAHNYYGCEVIGNIYENPELLTK